MQVVINISEDDYELACKWPDALIAVYAHAIKNGTPLGQYCEQCCPCYPSESEDD